MWLAPWVWQLVSSKHLGSETFPDQSTLGRGCDEEVCTVAQEALVEEMAADVSCERKK